MTKEYELQLKAWSQGENYTEGLRIWKSRYGEDMAYVMLCMGPNDFNREKMRSGLSASFPEEKPTDPKPAPKKPGKVAVLANTVDELESSVNDLAGSFDDLSDDVSGLVDNVDNLEDSFKELSEKVEKFMAEKPVHEIPVAKKRDIDEKEPEQIQKWRKTTYGLMNERTLLKQRLRDLPDPARRDDRQTAALRVLDCTEELDRLFGMIHYWEEHGRVPENVPIEEQGVVFPKRYLNLRTYVSRTQKKIKEDPNNVRRAEWKQKVIDWQKEMDEIEIEL